MASQWKKERKKKKEREKKERKRETCEGVVERMNHANILLT